VCEIEQKIFNLMTHVLPRKYQINAFRQNIHLQGANKLCLITQFFNFSILVKGDTYPTEFYSFQVNGNLSVRDKNEKMIVTSG
jgi:hypothetical protein